MKYSSPVVSAAITAFATLAVVSTVAAQPDRPRPKISEDSARVIARSEVPNGKIRSAELEHERGRWIYSFDIKVAGRPGIEEINVDAMTGKLVAHEHEGPAAERREARADARAKTARK